MPCWLVLGPTSLRFCYIYGLKYLCTILCRYQTRKCHYWRSVSNGRQRIVRWPTWSHYRRPRQPEHLPGSLHLRLRTMSLRRRKKKSFPRHYQLSRGKYSHSGRLCILPCYLFCRQLFLFISTVSQCFCILLSNSLICFKQETISSFSCTYSLCGYWWN